MQLPQNVAQIVAARCGRPLVPGLSGSVSLSPVQRDGADSVATSAAYDCSSSTFSVPARTVAVFVQPG